MPNLKTCVLGLEVARAGTANASFLCIAAKYQYNFTFIMQVPDIAV
jgi:hypothetical protein